MEIEIIILAFVCSIIGVFIGSKIARSIDFQRRVRNYSIKEVCKHQNQITRVIDTTANCETTVEVCIDCWKEVNQPKTDCR